MRGFSCEKINEADGYPGGFPAAVLVDREGTVWVKAPSGALLFRRKNESKFELSQYVSPPTSKGAFLHEDPEGEIWLSDETGLRRLDRRGSQVPIPTTHSAGRGAGPSFGDFAFGPDGSLWAVINERILRFSRTKWVASGSVSVGDEDSSSSFKGISSNAIWNLKINHEGSVCVGTNSGLDHVQRHLLCELLVNGLHVAATIRKSSTDGGRFPLRIMAKTDSGPSVCRHRRL